MDELANPLQACVTSAIAFSIGAGMPLLGGAFIADHMTRIYVVIATSTAALILFGATGAYLGGAKLWKGALRVLIGGWLAMVSGQTSDSTLEALCTPCSCVAVAVCCMAKS